MTTHKAAPADAARERPALSRARKQSVKLRSHDRILALRATGLSIEAISEALGLAIPLVKNAVRRAREDRDMRALTDKAAASVLAERKRDEAARLARAVRAAEARAEHAARLARSYEARAEVAARALAKAEAEAVSVAAAERLGLVPVEMEPAPHAVTRRGPIASAIRSPLVIDPARLSPVRRRLFVDMLRHRAKQFPEMSPSAGQCEHLADLYQYCSTFYQSLNIPADYNVHAIDIPLRHSPLGSPADMCAQAD